MERTETSALPLECVLGWMFIYIHIISKLNELQISVKEESCTVLPCISITIHPIQHNKIKAAGSFNTVQLVQNRRKSALI